MKLKEAIELPILLSKEQARDILELLSQLAELGWEQAYEARKVCDDDLANAKDGEVKKVVDTMTTLAKKIGDHNV